ANASRRLRECAELEPEIRYETRRKNAQEQQCLCGAGLERLRSAGRYHPPVPHRGLRPRKPRGFSAFTVRRVGDWFRGGGFHGAPGKRGPSASSGVIASTASSEFQIWLNVAESRPVLPFTRWYTSRFENPSELEPPERSAARSTRSSASRKVRTRM